MTYGKYITNASIHNISLNAAHDKLIEEWEKKNISYPRSNGIGHKPITILNKEKINPEVKKLLSFDLSFIKRKYKKVTKDTIYYIAEQLNLSTPSSLISDIERSIKYYKRKFSKEKIKEFLYSFKIDKSKDEYIKIEEAKLENIIYIKNKKLKKDKFNKELDILREK